mmetsp:Transcript_35675/g.43009  ORF Transcript_35675/g.43009 Transcript_35675/m.43009 type:complete len:173 (-) Transcript_35675:57-575(-)|eukprot:CAMPEP_0197864162 /NCGR_PEP_ID=MMETSP1438-20131217/42183_1 /TAXON_ID=1461541 /ORGANISM="Pterosperma sp., Strain CCMP1384" /LENGTH=172 /DNA_ID=CAMNT_0043482305 /DNA_START=445 /DNA_END=963 /DNA_ORIENTATION=+
MGSKVESKKVESKKATSAADVPWYQFLKESAFWLSLGYILFSPLADSASTIAYTVVAAIAVNFASTRYNYTIPVVPSLAQVQIAPETSHKIADDFMQIAQPTLALIDGALRGDLLSAIKIGAVLFITAALGRIQELHFWIYTGTMLHYALIPLYKYTSANFTLLMKVAVGTD